MSLIHYYNELFPAYDGCVTTDMRVKLWQSSINHQSVSQSVNQSIYFRHRAPYGKKADTNKTLNQWRKKKKKEKT